MIFLITKDEDALETNDWVAIASAELLHDSIVYELIRWFHQI